VAIGTLNILADSASSSGQITVVTGAGKSGLTYSSFTTHNATYRYVFEPDATKGIYDYARGIYQLTIAELTQQTGANRSLSLIGDDVEFMNAGTMGGANSTMTITGNGYNVNSYGLAG